MRSLGSITILASLTLSACSMMEPDVDYMRTGVDATGQLRLQANLLVPGMQTGQVIFAPGSKEIATSEAMPLVTFLDMGVQSVRIISPLKDSLRTERELALVRFLRGRGLESGRISTSTDSALASGTYRLEMATMDVTPPDCPNWSSSSTSSYSNLPWSQLGCAYVTNIGAMVADPQDLAAGAGNVRPDSARNSIVMQQYRSNKDWTPGAASGGGASASGTSFGGAGAGNSSNIADQSSGAAGAGSK